MLWLFDSNVLTPVLGHSGRAFWAVSLGAYAAQATTQSVALPDCDSHDNSVGVHDLVEPFDHMAVEPIVFLDGRGFVP